MTFLEKLDAQTARSNSLVCVGLDSDPRKIPAHLHQSPQSVLQFNTAIVKATSDFVCCYKINLAFYEALGREGYETIRGTIEAIPRDIPVLGDAKRGDIGNTAEKYAEALFTDLGFDAATVAPYMGADSIIPFTRYAEKGVFILALTSNPGSRDFQYLPIDGEPLYKYVVRSAVQWNQLGNCGLVVGATHPDELSEIRAMIGNMPILVPGLGAQGGDVQASVVAGVDVHGKRAVFNSSRAIIYASNGTDFQEKAREEARRFRNEINKFRGIALPEISE